MIHKMLATDLLTTLCGIDLAKQDGQSSVHWYKVTCKGCRHFRRKENQAVKDWIEISSTTSKKG